jgi:hypothetical protein
MNTVLEVPYVLIHHQSHPEVVAVITTVTPFPLPVRPPDPNCIDSFHPRMIPPVMTIYIFCIEPISRTWSRCHHRVGILHQVYVQVLHSPLDCLLCIPPL